jgi:hypothetical protein
LRREPPPPLLRREATLLRRDEGASSSTPSLMLLSALPRRAAAPNRLLLLAAPTRIGMLPKRAPSSVDNGAPPPPPPGSLQLRGGKRRGVALPGGPVVVVAAALAADAALPCHFLRAFAAALLHTCMLARRIPPRGLPSPPPPPLPLPREKRGDSGPSPRRSTVPLVMTSPIIAVARRARAPAAVRGCVKVSIARAARECRMLSRIRSRSTASKSVAAIEERRITSASGAEDSHNPPLRLTNSSGLSLQNKDHISIRGRRREEESRTEHDDVPNARRSPCSRHLRAAGPVRRDSQRHASLEHGIAAPFHAPCSCAITGWRRWQEQQVAAQCFREQARPQLARRRCIGRKGRRAMANGIARQLRPPARCATCRHRRWRRQQWRRKWHHSEDADM